MQTDEYACRLVDNLNLVVPFGLNNFDHWILDVGDAQEFALNPNFIPVLHSANVQTFEVADSLDETHPERAVLRFTLRQRWPNLRVVHELNLDSMVPALTACAPIALPFELV